MTKLEIKKLIKQLEEYKEENLTGYPFGKDNAYWATGLINFLRWLEIKGGKK